VHTGREEVDMSLIARINGIARHVQAQPTPRHQTDNKRIMRLKNRQTVLADKMSTLVKMLARQVDFAKRGGFSSAGLRGTKGMLGELTRHTDEAESAGKVIRQEELGPN